MAILLWILGISWCAMLAQVGLNLLRIPPVDPDGAVAGESGPLVSVVVPARNEARSLEPALRSLARQTYPCLEIILVDDCSTDVTGAIAREVAGESPRITVVDGAALPEGWLGKPHALKQGVARSRGDVLVFTDADVFHHERSVEAALALLIDRDADLVSLFPTVIAASLLEDVVFGAAVAVAVTVPMWVFNLEWLRQAGTAVGAFIMVRRKALERAGGVEAIRRAFVDDAAIGRIVKLAGGRCLLAHGEGLVRVRPFDGPEAIARGLEKNLFALFNNSLPLALFAFVLPVLALFVLPFVLWPLLGWGWLVGQVPLAHFAVASAIVTAALALRSIPWLRQEGFRGWLVPSLPLGACYWVFALLRAALKTWQRGATRWRGRDYPPGGPFGDRFSLRRSASR